MATADQIKNALLTEHFRYTPLTLLDDIINTVNELVFQAVNAIEESLFNTDVENLGFSRDNGNNDIDAVARTEIETGIVQLESLLNATIDKNFDKLEIYTLRNLLTVSNLKEDDGLENWVMLDHYKDIHAEAPTDGNTVTPESINVLRRKLQATEKLQAALKAEQAQNEALLTRLRAVATPSANSQGMNGMLSRPDSVEAALSSPSFAFLNETPAATQLGMGTSSSSHALAQNTKFTLSQLPALKALLQELRPYIASLPSNGINNEAANARSAYIESQARKAMARKGIDPDAGGQESSESLGRQMGADEVRAIEGIVGALGGRNARGGADVDAMEE